MFNIAHLSKIVVNFILIMMSKPKYIVILTGFFFFCSIVAGVLCTFTRFFPLMFWQGLIFWYDNHGLWPWQAKPRPKIFTLQEMPVNAYWGVLFETVYFPYTVNSRYLEVKGILSKTLRYPYFDISDLQN